MRDKAGPSGSALSKVTSENDRGILFISGATWVQYETSCQKPLLLLAKKMVLFSLGYCLCCLKSALAMIPMQCVQKLSKFLFLHLLARSSGAEAYYRCKVPLE